tara:strand:+ start:392 stop:1327 length:936 start_codon:yes stop_codon:yes gene_type:complete
MEKIKYILITGAAGFIGTNLVRRLVSLGFRIVCFDMHYSERFLSEFESKVHLYEGNLSDKEVLAAINTKFRLSYVFHLAGSKARTNGMNDFNDTMDNNYFGTLNLLESLTNNNSIKKIILVGTIDEYGELSTDFKESSAETPLSAYGLSKLACTKLGLIFYKQYNLPITIVRPSIVYGHNQGMEMFIPSVIEALLNNNSFDMTKGEQERDFLHIDDLIDVIMNIKESLNTNGEVFNVGSGSSIKIADIALHIAKVLQKEHLLNIGVIPYRDAESMNYSVSIMKAKEILSWVPKIDIIKGIERIILQTINTQ